MKLEEIILIVTKKLNVKRLICSSCMAIIFIVNGYAQEDAFQINELLIELEIISISEDDYHPDSPLLLKGDTFPTQIKFEFIVYNNSNKILMIGSNTRYHFKPYTIDSDIDYREIGRFLMIHGVDTIPLYTDQPYLYPDPYYSSTAIWATIESIYDSKEHPIFTSFLNRWADMAKRGENYIQGLYDYLKASRFVYVPIQADYQKRLDKFKDKSLVDCIIYPRKAIEVKKREPFFIIVGYSEEKDFYVYPPISR